MANADAPFGFRPVLSANGTDPQFNVFAPQGYSIASGYATNLFYGDPVYSTGTADTKGRPGIQVATTATRIRGIFAGVEYTDTNTGERKFTTKWPASTTATDIVAKVFDHPLTVFEIQGDEDIVAADIGNKADFIAGTGNTQTGLSAYELDSSNIGTGDQLLILGLSDRGDGVNELGNFAKALVLIREHELCDTYYAA